MATIGLAHTLSDLQKQLNPDGSIAETVASALMFCPMPPIPVNSIVECEGAKMRVIQCSQMHGFGAYSHLEVQLE